MTLQQAMQAIPTASHDPVGDGRANASILLWPHFGIVPAATGVASDAVVREVPLQFLTQFLVLNRYLLMPIETTPSR